MGSVELEVTSSGKSIASIALPDVSSPAKRVASCACQLERKLSGLDGSSGEELLEAVPKRPGAFGFAPATNANPDSMFSLVSTGMPARFIGSVNADGLPKQSCKG